MKAAAQYLGIVILGSFLLWKGILPAFTSIDTDFPNYYTASRLVAEGRDVSQIYNDEWFGKQIASYGIDRAGKFSPFPPPTIFVMLPLAMLAPLTALRIWTLINIGVLVATVILLSKVTNRNWQWNALLVLSGGVALSNNFRFGQFYLILLLTMVIGYYCWQRRQTTGAGIMLGLGIAVKYFPFVLFPFFVIRKEWRLLFVCVATLVAAYGLAMVVVGPEVFHQFVRSVLPDHFDGRLSSQDPFSPVFQSWNSLLRRLFVYDPLANPNPPVNSYPVFVVLKYAVVFAVVSLTAWALIRLQKSSATTNAALQVGLLVVAGLLLLPASATYHFVLLALPIGLLLSSHEGKWRIEQKLFAVCYVSMNFIPYRFFLMWSDSGFLTIFAYPRLWLMTFMFALTIMLVLRPRTDFAQNHLETIIP